MELIGRPGLKDLALLLCVVIIIGMFSNFGAVKYSAKQEPQPEKTIECHCDPPLPPPVKKTAAAPVEQASQLRLTKHRKYPADVNRSGKGNSSMYAGKSGRSVTQKYPGIAFRKDYDNYMRNRAETETGEEAILAFHSYAVETNIDCKDKHHYGLVTDGGWTACVSEPYIPKYNDCLVYSFGISNDFSFDDEISEMHGCKVLSFDPSMKKDSFRRNDLNWFYNLGLSGTNGMKNTWKMETLKTMLTNFGHLNTTIDILKMDIEASEWQALPNIFEDRSYENIKQLIFEVHVYNDNIMKYLKPLKMVDIAGFRKFNVRINHFNMYLSKSGKRLSKCYELSYINLKYV